MVRPLKVLIIDDDPDIRRIAHICLTRLGGMDVLEADDADHGLKRAVEEKPDVILLDIMMPRVDGLTTIKSLQSRAETSKIPVIFLTAGLSAESDTVLQRTGARGWLAKPFDPMTLATRLRALLEA